MLQNNFTGLIPNPAEGDTFDDFMFGVARAHEFVMTLMWLYENHPRDNAEVILDTIDLLFEGTRKVNLDWNVFFTEGNFPTQGTPNITTNGFTHGVNTAEGNCSELISISISKLIVSQAFATPRSYTARQRTRV
jgi:hypothetical protein